MKTGVLICGVLLVFIGSALVYSLRQTLTVDEMPDISLHIIDGREIDLKSLQGSPVLVTFWATSCSSCLKEMPHLIELYHELNGEGLEILGIAMAYDPPNHVVSLSKQKNIPYPVALDIDGSAARAFGDVSLTPTNILIGPNGKVIKHKTGIIDMHDLKKEIRKLLANRQQSISFQHQTNVYALV